MKDTEAKIIDMVAAGSITAEQAKVLLEEVRASEREAERPDDRNTFERIIGAISGGRTSNVRGVLPSDLHENDLSMSRVDVKGSGDYAFRGNRVRMSDLSSVELSSSQLIDNEFGSSSLHDIKATDSTLSRSIFHSSSLSDVQLQGAQVMKLGLRASRMHDATFEHSQVDTFGVSASSLKGFVLAEDSSVHHSRIDASQVSSFVAKRTQLQDVEIDVAKIVGLVLTGSTLRMSMVRGYKWVDVKLIDTVFEDVLFGSGEHTKQSKFHDVTFESCNLTKAIFSDTSFHDVTVKNVTLSGVKVIGVSLRDVVIDGNEQFLRAIGTQAESVSVR